VCTYLQRGPQSRSADKEQENGAQAEADESSQVTANHRDQ